MLNGWSAFAERFDDASDLSGTLRVVAPIALGQRHLIDATVDWQRAFPNLQINWQLDDSELNLAETGADVWIRIGRPRDDRLVVRDLAQVERLVVAHSSVVKPGETTDPKFLEGLPAVSLAPFEGQMLPLTHQTEDEVTIRANSRLVTNNIFAALNAAKSGCGFAIMPRWLVADELSNGTLIDILPEWRAPTLTVTACYLPSRRQSRALNAFLDMAETALNNLANA
ncbi:MAG: substrate binding domain-containing protein [Pseudomonadota bacterium]